MEVKSGSVGSVTFVDGQPQVAEHEIVCPHCKRAFESQEQEPIGMGERQGCKCPHCRLFVALERAASD
jgi:uncharacterized Zn-finger protein